MTTITAFQAIQSKYLSPTNTKGARVKVTCSGGSITEGREYGEPYSNQAYHLALKLMDKLGWSYDVDKVQIGCINNDYVITHK